MGEVPFFWKHFLQVLSIGKSFWKVFFQKLCFSNLSSLLEGLLASAGSLSSKILKGILLRCQLQGIQCVIDTICNYEGTQSVIDTICNYDVHLRIYI